MSSNPGFLELSRRTEAHAVHLRLTGELDYDTTPEFLAAVRGILSGHAGLRSLHLDCAGLAFCDTMGLYAFLTIRRETGAADVQLHLDNRSPALQRLLEITGTLTHLTGAVPSSPSHHGAPDRTGSGQGRSADSQPS